MENAEKYACEVLVRPTDLKYAEAIRQFQGCPTIAVTRGGRIYLGWYSGGVREPHIRNYNLLVYSDDQGASWSDPLLVIPGSREKGIHALDIQLFIDPDGALHVLWVQNNVSPTPEIRPSARPGQPLVFVDGYMFNDFRHSEWEVVCREPDAEQPVFSEPRYLYPGFLRCKPTFLANGDWLCFAYDQLNDRYGYSLSSDGGRTFRHDYGSKKKATWFDEAMAYQLEDGRLRMLARCALGELAECISADNGRTWSETRLSGITAADTRFFVKKLPSRRVLLVTNADPAQRRDMTVSLSEDDGRTWAYQVCIDAREDVSYPDADVAGDRIYLTYDRGRTTHKEILFCSFTEQDILEGRAIPLSVVSKPPAAPAKEEVVGAVVRHGLIAILRGIPEDKLLPTAEALYRGGIRLLEVPFCADGRRSDPETADQIKRLVRHFDGRLLVGAGTVLTAHQVRLTKAAGGAFVLSPNTDSEVIFECHLCGLVSIPGALTPTEIAYAHACGADFVKLFPAAGLSPAYVRAVLAPLPHIRLLAVGGIREEDLPEYRKAGVCGFGIGSRLVDKSLVDAGDYDGITALAEKYTEGLCHG